MTPNRIQRKRTKGWRMPEGAVFVGHPTQWGNPFTVDQFRTAKRAVKEYRGHLQEMMRNHLFACRLERELRGKDLACWCPIDKPCHADVLLEFANKEDL